MEAVEVLERAVTRLSEKVDALESSLSRRLEPLETAAKVTLGKRVLAKWFYAATTVAVAAILAVVLGYQWEGAFKTAVDSFTDKKTNLTLSQLADQLREQVESTKSIDDIIENKNIMTWDQPAYVVFTSGGVMRYTGANKWDVMEETVLEEEARKFKGLAERGNTGNAHVRIRRLPK